MVAAGAGVSLFLLTAWLASRAQAASLGAGVAAENYTDARVPAALRDEYIARYLACVVDPGRLAAVDRMVDRIVANKPRYEPVSAATGVPWYVIGLIHGLEAGFSFNAHLHNGDPLTARTYQQPEGRPVSGSPPFTWEESALDALAYDHLTGWGDWDLVGTLYKLEAFNGMGYRHLSPPIPSPYLWAGSNQYAQGKFTSDGHYDPSAVSQQIGAATALKRMQQRGVVGLL